MKKSLFILAAALTVFACSKDPEQEQAAVSIEINATEASVEAAGGSTTITITANTAWAASSAVDWITVDPARGEGNGTLTLTVAENEIPQERSGVVSINSTAKKLSFTVKQAAAEIKEDAKLTEIKSAEDFVKFGNTMMTYTASETVKLAADITVTAPIDSLLCNFDGQDHTITLDYTATEAEPANVGLFRYTRAAIKNLKTSGSIKSAQEGTEAAYSVGGIAGHAFAGASFENCTNGMAVSATNCNTYYLGGVVGYTEAGVNLTNCKNTGKVEYSFEGASKGNQVGGILGHLEGSGVVTSCTNDGDVMYAGGGTVRMGGIAGYVNNLVDVTFKECINNGSVDNDGTGYTDSSWAYLGGISGYYGTPTVGGKVLYDGCVNNGAVTSNLAETKLRCRIGGINAHAGNSKTNPDADGNGVHTWELKNCTNNGDLTLKGCIAATRAQVGGIQAYGEPGGTVIIDGCTSNGKITSDNLQAQAKWNAIGGLLGGNAAVNSKFINNTVTSKVVMTGNDVCAIGLLVGINNPYTTELTGKVGAATIVKGETSTVISADNFASFLLTADLGTGGSVAGVTFAN